MYLITKFGSLCVDVFSQPLAVDMNILGRRGCDLALYESLVIEWLDHTRVSEQ